MPTYTRGCIYINNVVMYTWNERGDKVVIIMQRLLEQRR